MSASRWRSAWKPAIGRPNWRRSAAYRQASSSMRPAAPTASAAASSMPIVAIRRIASPPSGSASSGASTRSTAYIGAVGSNAGCATSATSGAAGSTMPSTGPCGAAATNARRSTLAACSTAVLRPLTTWPRATAVGAAAAAQLAPGSSSASATESSAISAASGSAANRTAALPRYGTGARCAPSARAIMHSSTAPSPSSPPTASAPKSTRRSQSRSGSASRASSVSTDSPSHFCSSLSSKSIESLLWKGEDAIGDDVALDLLRAAVDGRGARVQVGLAPEVVLVGRLGLGVLERRRQDLERGCRQPLLGLGHEQLDARAVGTDSSAGHELADGSVRMVPQDLDADQCPGEGGLRPGIVDQGPAVDPALGRHAHGTVQPGAKLDLPRQRGGAALVTERVHRDLPAVAELAEEVRLGNDDVVEEQLAELGVAGDLRHRPQLDARRAHVDEQHRDLAVLRLGVVRARQHAAPAGELPPRDPGLLPADHERLAPLLRSRSQRREVRPGVGL